MYSHLNNFTGIYLNQRPAPKRHIDNLYEYTRLSNFDKASDPEKEEGNQEVCVCECVCMRDGEKRKDGENNIFNPKKGPHGMTNGHKEKQEDRVTETNKTSNKRSKKQKSRTSNRMMDRWKKTLESSKRKRET